MHIKKVEFPNLNGLRFFAAFGVVITHLEQSKYLLGLPNQFSSPGVGGLGTRCVWLFFVLSGFLITYLLMEEKRIFKSVNIFKFYVRRVLRIWPLYFIICLLGFGLLPAISFFDVPSYPPVWSGSWLPTATAYMAFSAHIASVWLPPVAYAGVLWSIGVEEWFYAVWPWMIKYALRWELHILVGTILLMNLTRVLVPPGNLRTLLYTMRFDCMATGGLFAMLLYSKDAPLQQRILRVLFRFDTQVVFYLLLAAAMVFGWSFWPLEGPAYALLFGILVLNLAGNPRSILRLETPWLHRLGDLSYGIYCYNWITAVIAVKLVQSWLPGAGALPVNLAIYALGTGLVLLLSELSYRYIEERFLSLKRRAFTLLPNLDQPPAETKDGTRGLQTADRTPAELT